MTRAEITRLANRYGYQLHPAKESANPKQKRLKGWILSTELQWAHFTRLSGVALYLEVFHKELSGEP